MNPNYESVLGFPCYPRLEDIPFYVSLMAVLTPAETVPSLMRSAAIRGDIRQVIILASGFAETGLPDRVALEREAVTIAKDAGIRVMGPNCIGVMNAHTGLDTTFAPRVTPRPGGLSVVSQSGALGAALLLFAGDHPVPMGFSKFCHVGNQSDVGMLEVLDYYSADADTRVVGLYLEGVRDGREFAKVAGRLSQAKPVVALKVGRSSQGTAAALSHTGALAGSDAVYDGCFQQAGVIRAETMEDLLGYAKALSMSQVPKGDGICVLTQAGGPGTVAVDEITMNGGRLATFAPKTLSTLREMLPPMAMIGRPNGYVDMTAAANEEHHAQALETVLEDDGVDMVVMISVPPTYASPVEIAKGILKAVQRYRKPVLACLMAGQWVREARAVLEVGGVPTYDMPDQAARAALALAKRSGFLKGLGA